VFCENRKVLSLDDLKTGNESLIRTICGREFKRERERERERERALKTGKHT